MASLLAPISLDDDAVSDGDYLADVSDDEGVSNTQDEPGSRTSWKHDKLIKSIGRLDKTPLSQMKIKRSEPASNVGDQDVSGTPSRSISISALLRKADKSGPDKALKKKLHTNDESKILAEPLKKIEAVKIQRVVAYEETTADLKKWDTVVSTNRTAEGLSFPLDQTKMAIQTTGEYVKRYQTKTPLEQQIADLVENSRNNFTKSTILTEAEKEALEAMSLHEAEFRRHELQKTRALLSYKEQKARWQAKIKSKTFHRHLRKSKLKVDEKEFEELKKNDPEAAAHILEGLDKKRLVERLTLKHRNMGKWARHIASRAKNDKDARSALQEQLRLSRSLTEKPRQVVEAESSEDEEQFQPVNETVEKALDAEAVQNPWFTSVQSSWEDDSMDKVFESLEINEQAEAKKPPKRTKQQPLANRSRPAPKKSFRQQDKSDSEDEPDFDHIPEFTDGGELVADVPNVASSTPRGISAQHHNSSWHDTDVDPSNVLLAISKNRVFRTIMPGVDSGFEDLTLADSDEDQRNVIAEAFADDDVMVEFEKEKAEVVDKQKPKDVDLTLPGWNEWAGAGTEPTAKKAKFVVKAPKMKPRKDRLLTNVIISERHDEKIVPYQVKELPFPFTTVPQFHSSIRAPIGKTWNTEASFDSLTKPRYTTVMGAVIKPLNGKSVLQKSKRKADETFADEADSGSGNMRVAKRTSNGGGGARNGRKVTETKRKRKR